MDGDCNWNGGTISCAGVMRDYKGMIRGGFLFNIGGGDSYKAEVWGSLWG